MHDNQPKIDALLPIANVSIRPMTLRSCQIKTKTKKCGAKPNPSNTESITRGITLTCYLFLKPGFLDRTKSTASREFEGEIKYIVPRPSTRRLLPLKIFSSANIFTSVQNLYQSNLSHHQSKLLSLTLDA